MPSDILRKNSEDDILVLLACYNGEKYILEQLESIVNQSVDGVHILIRDDGSNDRTVEVVTNFIAGSTHTNIKLVTNQSCDKGHLSNFSALCKLALESDFQYFCFSDQDDIWKKEKLEIQLSELKSVESNTEGSIPPVLVHSDLEVVNEQANTISESFIYFQGLPLPENHDFPQFLYQNVVTGCVSFFNRRMLEVAAPLPKSAVVHDWWFALCAKAFGELVFIPKSLILYRQHSGNAIGATERASQRSYFNRYFYKAILHFPKNLVLAIRQADALLKLIRSNKTALTIDENKVTSIVLFSALQNCRFRQRMSLVKHYFRGKRSLGELLYLYFVFCTIKWM